MDPRKSNSALTRAQRQDELVNMFPGTAKVISRPRTNPDGSEVVTRTVYEFPDFECKRRLKNLYQAMRLCGRHGNFAEDFRSVIKESCGIEVDLDVMEKAIGNGFATAPSSVQK